ncbi:MAG TPA: hypothetical protein PLP49_12185 [Anaerohalosphaeraceae bacterium]|nr:hypothetical protein [Anaerohalosphaeraceae bacterium]HRT24554.1 hypothetical protein [Anaerohalosphaeraceae bacterium]
METKNEIIEGGELLPVETPEMEISKVLNEGDPDVQLAILEKKAALAPRFSAAIEKILLTQTYPEDWQEFGGKMCLSSAGAERVARLFDIQFFDVRSKKEEFTDSIGKGYRYIFEGKASMGGRTIYAQGTYSTRDKFFGFSNGSYKDAVEINENNIRNAAYHIFIGNAVKALLGLRGIPKEKWEQIMRSAGAQPEKAKAVKFADSSKGGTTEDEHSKQVELSNLLINAAKNNLVAVVDENGNLSTKLETAVNDFYELAKSSCVAVSSFYSKRDNKFVSGFNSVKELKGKRLDYALANAKKLFANTQNETEESSNGTNPY